jgi:hypothetical protein
MCYTSGYLQAIPASSLSPIQIYPEDDPCLERLTQMRANEEVTLARTKDQLKVMLMRPRVEFWAYGNGEDISSYIAAFDNRVWEYQGVTAEIPGLIRYFGLSHGYEAVNVVTPSVFGAHEEQLYKWATSFELKPMVFLKILRFRQLVEKLLPGMLERATKKRISDLEVTLVLQETNEQVNLTISDGRVLLTDEPSGNISTAARIAASASFFFMDRYGVTVLTVYFIWQNLLS